MALEKAEYSTLRCTWIFMIYISYPRIYSNNAHGKAMLYHNCHTTEVWLWDLWMQPENEVTYLVL